jgi:hypothetical protein
MSISQLTNSLIKSRDCIKTNISILTIDLTKEWGIFYVS